MRLLLSLDCYILYSEGHGPSPFVEGRADGLRTSIAAVSAHGAAAILVSLGYAYGIARRKDGN